MLAKRPVASDQFQTPKRLPTRYMAKNNGDSNAADIIRAMEKSNGPVVYSIVENTKIKGNASFKASVKTNGGGKVMSYTKGTEVGSVLVFDVSNGGMA